MGEHLHKAKPPRKIAILGTASPSLKSYPEKQDSGWELWGMSKATVHRELRQGDGCHQYFEPHKRLLWEAKVPVLAKIEEPIWMQQHWDDVPTSREYPLARVLDAIPPQIYGRSAATPRGSHRSTIGWMIAFAILELGAQHGKAKDRRDTIGLWGVEMSAEGEYAYQKPNCEALLGYALGLGIDVVIPETSSLMKGNTAYGYEDRSLQAGPLNYDYLFRRKSELEKVLQKAERSEAGAEYILKFLAELVKEKFDGQSEFHMQRDWVNRQGQKFSEERLNLLGVIENLRGQTRLCNEMMHLLESYDRGAPMAGAMAAEAVKALEAPSNGATKEPVPVGAAVI